jgi:hypothetical protein
MASREALGLTTVVGEEAARLNPRGGKPTGAVTRAAAVPEQPGHIGLALSGGGIRSATFCLGVLQALSQRQRLASFDYLSTVSGGGYIGSWLSAWIKRAGLHAVQCALGGHAAPPGAAPAAHEPPEVTWLRRYSNYLAPRVGLFSLDSLTLVATWLRNVGLNLVVLLSCLAVAFIAPLLLLEPLSDATRHSRAFGFAASWLGLVFLLAIAFNLWHQSLTVNRRLNWLISAPGVVATVVLPALLAAGAGAVWLFQPQPAPEGRVFGVIFVALLLAILLTVWFIAEGIKRRFPAALFREVMLHAMAGAFAFAAGAGVLVAVHAVWLRLIEGGSETLRIVLLASFGAPAVLLAFGVASTVFTGLVGRVYFERSREWWSRLNARFMVFGGVWFVLCLLAFFALPTLTWLAAQIGSWTAVVGSGWIGSLLAAVFGRVPEKASKAMQHRIDGLLNLAAGLFVAGLLFLVAAGTSAVILASAGIAPGQVADAIVAPSVSFDFSSVKNRVEYQVSVDQPRDALFADFVAAHIAALAQLRAAGSPIDGIGVLGFAFLLLTAVALLFGWRVDVNKFSLHNMYKNRLVRCYLGASNQPNRNEQPFVGLDDGDDLPLRDLAGPAPTDPVQRPLHIINTALNIAQGANLAWQERKAASFVLTPLYCGFSLALTQGDSTGTRGYRPTAQYAASDGEEPGFTLGMALATSGAAVSPNMGRATKPALAFVLTLFNMRLGRWSPNPAGDMWRQPSPRFGLVALLQELLGQSNETSNYVYLSDGGHFDNLGLYELVRRRCAVIFAVDCGADPERKFGDLAEAIRKCRVDLGVEISVDHLEFLRGDKSMRADRGFVEGTIQYDPADPTTNGRLILLKPTLCRAQKEPADVLNYAAKNPPFPQQTTSDQFFDESQFESYRRLGLYIGHQCLEEYESLLPLQVTAPAAVTPVVPRETPTFATQWLAGLFFRRRSKGRPLPARAGALVDFFAVALLVVLAGLAGFAAFDWLRLPGYHAFPCFSTASCLSQSQALLGAVNSGVPIWENAIFWRTLLDNFFVVVYLAMFVMGFIVAVNRWTNLSTPRRKWAVLAALCAVALLAAGIDYVENFVVLAMIAAPEMPPNAAQQLAPFTAAKYQVVAVSVALLVLRLGQIVRQFRQRWHDTVASSGPTR